MTQANGFQPNLPIDPPYNGLVVLLESIQLVSSISTGAVVLIMREVISSGQISPWIEKNTNR
jgi:hypothetical protein